MTEEERERLAEVERKAAEKDADQTVPSDDLKTLIATMTDVMKKSADAMEKMPEMLKDIAVQRDKDRQRAIDGKNQEPTGLQFKDRIVLPATTELDKLIHKANNDCVDMHLYYSAGVKKEVLDVDYDPTLDEHGVPKGMRKLKCWKTLQDLKKKAAGDLWSTDAGATAEAGAEWVPVGYSTNLIDVERLEQNVAGIFQQVQVPQGMGTLRVPVKTSKSSWAISGEFSEGDTYTFPFGGGTPVNAGTSFVVLGGVKHKGISEMSREETEDAVLAVLPIAREELAMSGIDSIEDAIINGQPLNAATLDDTGGTAAGNGYSVDGTHGGLRMYCIATNANTHDVAGNLDLAAIETGRSQMGIFGIRPGRVAIITTPGGYLDLIQETDSPVKTVDLFGPRATILSGQLASVYGMPILVSEQIPTTLSTAGRLDAPAARTMSIMVDRSRWRRGNKRSMEIKQIDVVGDDVMILVGFVRTSIGHAPPDTDDHVVGLINQTR